jgi:peptidoglycan biosynthesis protein MviN/MurJ (putative lipid II flippase)
MHLSNLTNMNKPLYAALLAVVAAGFAGCVYTTVDVKPIHITVDVNVRVEKALEDFFGDLDAKSSTLKTPNAQP